jgi:hypothetical protein
MTLKDKKDKEGVARLLQLIEAHNVTKVTADKHQLNLLSDNRYGHSLVRVCRVCVFVSGGRA